MKLKNIDKVKKDDILVLVINSETGLRGAGLSSCDLISHCLCQLVLFVLKKKVLMNQLLL